MNEELIIKYLSQQGSDDEHRALLAWVRQSDTNLQEFISYCATWHAAADSTHFDADAAFARFTASTHQASEKKRIVFWKPLMAVAAVAMLFVGLFFLYTPQQQQEFVTVANSDTKPQQVILPDNSEIILQQGAQITYPTQFADDNRAIQAQGVLYCKIARNEQAPFTIDCNEFSVEVLGTEFMVGTEANNGHVIVETGKVRVHNTNTKEFAEITANERVDIKQYGVRKTRNNDANFHSWSTGLLKFSNTPLSQVFADLQRHYNCNITVTDAVIHSCKMTGTYQDMELNEILEIIHSAFPHIQFTLSHGADNADEITVHL
ncbi:MAG: FecR domain-containing protein [Bacteroidales bacterium]|jgi:ferric-dicitrate binding protein FerR (iron transport regulator)|nr:FecR domain-containing protein [Bacteroidales bacterium]